MSRRPLIAGNAKMNLGRAELTALLRGITSDLAARPAGADVLYCPPFPWLGLAAELLQGSPVALGAQTMHEAEAGAFTGEVSAGMLREAGCTHVLLGHSERRTLFGETDAGVRAKTRAAWDAGLTPVVCVGETEQERRAGATETVLARQMVGSLGGLSLPGPDRLVLAYEPVWAIGTGNVATPEQAQEAHRRLRGELGTLFGPDLADRIRILYGGSVKPDNAAGLLSQPDLDGALVGGASLVAESFMGILQGAAAGA